MAFPYDQSAQDNLIDGQLTPNAVADPALLDAMRQVPREAFVPQAFRNAAYVDEAIPLGQGRFLMEPLVQARLLQALALRAHESLLIIGGTTGYSAAVASNLVARVELVEESPEMVKMAQSALAQLSISNVNVAQHLLAHGAPGAAPYDAVLIEGAFEMIPQALIGQLKDGGRLVAVQRTEKAPNAYATCGTAVLCEKHGSQLSSRPLFDAGVAVLPGFTVPVAFEFCA